MVGRVRRRSHLAVMAPTRPEVGIVLGDQAPLVEVGDSNSTAPVCPARGQKAIGMAACGFNERPVTAPVHRCPVFAGRLRTQRGPKERFRRLDATRHSGLLRQGIGSVG